jgi:hypothetical protein
MIKNYYNPISFERINQWALDKKIEFKEFTHHN